MEFTCNVTEELVDRLTSNASLAIEVWGHKDRYSAETARAPSQLSHLPIELSSRSCASSQPVPQNTNFRLRGSSLLSEKNKSLKERFVLFWFCSAWGRFSINHFNLLVKVCSDFMKGHGTPYLLCINVILVNLIYLTCKIFTTVLLL